MPRAADRWVHPRSSGESRSPENYSRVQNYGWPMGTTGFRPIPERRSSNTFNYSIPFAGAFAPRLDYGQLGRCCLQITGRPRSPAVKVTFAGTSSSATTCGACGAPGPGGWLTGNSGPYLPKCGNIGPASYLQKTAAPQYCVRNIPGSGSILEKHYWKSITGKASPGKHYSARTAGCHSLEAAGGPGQG